MKEEFSIRLAGSINKMPPEWFCQQQLSRKAIKIFSILHHILSPSLSFPPRFDGFIFLPFPPSFHAPPGSPSPHYEWGGGLDAGREEGRRGDPSLGTQARKTSFSGEAGVKNRRHARRHRQRSKAAWDAGLINPNCIPQYCID